MKGSSENLATGFQTTFLFWAVDLIVVMRIWRYCFDCMERNTLFLFQIEQGKNWLKGKDSLKVIDCIRRTLLCRSW
ncbi:hypothetical protein HMPREF3156_02933 [Neisseria sp. HMSC06F02]|nr:hypothetical protein HMPREF3156_02933 [Neisseria sp. HMSC06F02]